jgi:hypothetical protein
MLTKIGKMPEPCFIFLIFCGFPAKITLCQIGGKLGCRHVNLLRSGFVIYLIKNANPVIETSGFDH